MAHHQVSPPYKRLLTIAEAAAYCGICVATFKAHLRISPVHIGKAQRYDVRDIDKWINSKSNTGPKSDDDWLEGLE